MPGEAVAKHVAVLSVTGRDFKVEPIRLKTVRPFVIEEIVLHEDKTAKVLAKKENNRTKLTQYLMSVVDDLIEQAKTEWLEAQDEPEQDEELEAPLPLVRLRVEYSAPDGGSFDCENPQRFSNRFVGRVANVNDVVQFHRKKAGTTRKTTDGASLPEESILAQLSIDSVKIEKLVREFLTAQSLTILPQNSFGDAVSQYVDKDDKHAMEMFVNESLSNQIKNLMDVDQVDEDDLQNAMDKYKSKLEELFAAGHLRKAKKARIKPRPDDWDSDIDGGHWEDQPGALIRSDDELFDENDDEASLPSTISAPRGRGKSAGRGGRPTAAAAKKAQPAKTGRGKKKVVEEESEEEDDDVVMVDSDEDESGLFVKPGPAARGGRKTGPAKNAASPAKRAPARAAATASAKQSKLSFSQPATQKSQVNGKGVKANEVSADDISDDDDNAFEPPPATARSTRSRR